MISDKHHKHWNERDALMVVVFGDLFDTHLARKDKAGYWQKIAEMLGRTSMACQLYYSRYLRRSGQVQTGEVRRAKRTHIQVR